MTGPGSAAQDLMSTLTRAGIEVCFANPGTTEMPLVEALDAVGGLRPVLGLFEGVCSGAADGYGRMAGRPAMTLLHLGPGLGNGIANLHNAARARTPLVNVVGEHATWHRGRGAPLETDIEGLARPVSKWVRTSQAPDRLAADGAEAAAAAQSSPGGVATLIVPADCAWSPGGGAAADPGAPSAPGRVDEAAVEAAAGALAADGRAALFLGAGALREHGLRAAGRIAAATDCLLLSETFPARMERGGDLPAVTRLPYFPEEATAALAPATRLVLAGAPEPVTFFGYPGVPSEVAAPGTRLVALARPEEDAAEALERLAERLGAPAGAAARAATANPGPPQPPEDGLLTAMTAAQAVAAGQPEEAIVVDESVTVSVFYVAASAGVSRHSYLALTGGAIGQGPPCATGAAIACPDRPVIALQADGSAMYTIQALWTQAREDLDVTTLICSNRSYEILLVELARAGIPAPGPRARALTQLGEPPFDWLGLARGMGVPAARATTVAELSRELARALAEPGPHLVEMVLARPDG